ncbi:MAG: shikimate kinase [Desulfobacterales bacterium]|nr:shikimate kinase [Deltaproteobacteria bacterium]NNL43445.1 shikimate kinase [Desulfobacterales bacterium]
MNIFLIGHRGSGKTTVGSSLSDIIGWSFIDTDFQLVEELEMSILEIVDKKGWEFFRKKETAILKNICSHDNQIVATGGGIVLNKENRVNMKKSGKIIWLKATFSTVKKRMLFDSKTKDFRPALTSKKVDEEIKETLLLRTPYYKKIMDFSIDTDNLDIHGVCIGVMANLTI